MNSEETLENPKRLDMRQMAMICIVTFVEPVQFGVIFPFVYFMVQGFQIESDPKQLGKYVGILTSTFCFAQLLSSLPWGWISNRIGRKTVVIIGLIGNAITCSLFGLSKTFAFAMLTRFFCGLLNGNLGVIKSMLGEMTDDSNRSIAFSYWEAAAGLGQIFGPVLGGILVNPATRFPDYFGDCQFLRENPYFLPCFVSSLFSISGAVLGYFFMKERTSKEHDAEREPLLTSELDDIESSAQIEVQPSVAKILNRKVCAAIAMYGMWCLVTIIFEEIYTILVAEPIGKGGLAFNSYDIGLNLSMTGLVQVIVQLCVFPSLQRSLGLPNVYRLAAITMVIFSVGLSYCPDISFWITNGGEYSIEEKNLMFYIVLAIVSGKTFSSVLGYIPVIIFVNNSAPDAKSLAIVHGWGQVAASLVRTIGPLSGYVWSWSLSHQFPFDYHMSLFLCAILSVASYFTSYL